MPSFFKQFNLLRWVRHLFTKIPKRQSSTTTASASLNKVKKNSSRTERTFSIPFSLRRPTTTSILSRKPNKYRDKNKDGWTTIFLDEDKDWFSDSNGSTELRPVITSGKPPVLPKYVKSVGGVTDFRQIVRFQTEESLRRNREEGDILEEIPYPGELVEEIPLADMNRSSYLFEIAGLDESDDENEFYHNYEQSDGLLRPRPHRSEEDLYRRTGSSSPSIISIMQRKYEEGAKRRLKYEALHELSVRVKRRLQLLQPGNNSGLSSSPTSHSSLTSDGGDLEINLPRSFYRKIRYSSKKSDEVRRSRVYPWMTTLKEDYPVKKKQSQGK